MKAMFTNRMMLIVICLGVISSTSGRLNAQEAAPDAAVPASDAAVAAENDMPFSPVLTLGVLGGDDYFEGRADTLLPVWSMFDGNGLVLGNMRAAFGDEGTQELNIGLLYRHYVSGLNAIIGANVYYDGRWTEEDSQFNQLGLGLECLTTWVDARVNVYIPESDKDLISQNTDRTLTGYTDTTSYEAYVRDNQIREIQRTTRVSNYRITTIDTYEVPLEGLDAEIGVKLPLGIDNLEARLFAGYYDFEPKWNGNVSGDDQVSGMKGRFEVRAWNRLFLNAELYEDDDLYGSDYLVSASIRLPLGRDMLKETFSCDDSGPLTVSERMLEMVVRDPQIQIRDEMNLFEELEAELAMIYRDFLLLGDVIFVYGNNVADAEEDGSATHPFDVVQEGVDASNVRGMENVYVFGASTPYQENVLIENQNIQLIGEGASFGNSAAPTYGFGRPIIEGQAVATITTAIPAPVSPSATLTIRDAGVVSVGGFDFTAADVVYAVGSVSTLDSMGLSSLSSLQAGVMAEDVTTLTLFENNFRDLLAGVVTINTEADGFDHRILNNTFNNVGVGIGSVFATSGDSVISGNTIENSLLGIGVVGMSPDMVSTLSVGAKYSIPVSGRVNVDITGNTISGTAFDLADIPASGLIGSLIDLHGYPESLPIPTVGGILALALPGADMGVRVADNTITHPLIGVAGLAITPYLDPTILDFEVSGNTLTGGGIEDVIQLLGAHLGMTLPESLGFDLGLLGVGAIAIGEGAVMNNTIIADNVVSDYVIGIGAAALFNAEMTDASISGNLLEENLIGILGLAVDGGDLQRISIADNTVKRGALDMLNPLLSESGLTTLFGSDPLQLPDINIGGITLLGVWNSNLDDFSITGNTVSDNLLGIGVGSLIGTTANDGVISDNILENNILGIAAVGYEASMEDLEIGRNRITGGGTFAALDSVLDMGGVPEGIDPGASAITLIGVDSTMDRFNIHDNVISEQLIGIGVLSLGDSEMNDGFIVDNTISDTTVGIFGGTPGLGFSGLAKMDRIAITGNTLVGLADGSMIGVGLYGSGGDNMSDFVIQGNTVSHYASGIGAYDDGANIFTGDISLNTVSDYDVGMGILALDISGDPAVPLSSPVPVYVHGNTL